MNQSKSKDSPSTVALVCRVLCFLLPVPLLAIGWPTVSWLILDYLGDKAFPGGYGDCDLLCTPFCMIIFGTFMGIQISADLVRPWQSTRRRSSYRFTLLSACCISLLLFFPWPFLADNLFDGRLIPYGPLWDFCYFCLVLVPAIAWLLVNVRRFMKGKKAAA